MPPTIREQLKDAIDEATGRRDWTTIDGLAEAVERMQPSDQDLKARMGLALRIRTAWKLADAGLFAEAEEAIQADLRDGNSIALNAWHILVKKQEALRERINDLNRTAESQDWVAVKSAAASVLAIASRHPVALQMHRRAAAELMAAGVPSELAETAYDASQKRANMTNSSVAPAELNSRVRDQLSRLAGQTESACRPILWIDGVGGFLISDLNEAVIGQSFPGSQSDYAIVGDLSRRAAVIRRTGDSHLLQPLQATRINGHPVDRATLLNHRDRIAIGERIELSYSKANPLSTTALLRIESSNRWQPPCDGVLLAGDSILIGAKANHHLVCPHSSAEVILFRNNGQWWIRSSSDIECDGASHSKPVPLEFGKRFCCEDLTMTLEAG